jgi:hypothetical protein
MHLEREQGKRKNVEVEATEAGENGQVAKDKEFEEGGFQIIEGGVNAQDTPDDRAGDEADRWLKEHDPEKRKAA